MTATAIQSAAAADLFEADAPNWDAYYERSDVFSVIHQLRRSLALAWVDELALPARARVLDVGCGTGLLAVDLSRRGLHVTGLDSAVAMLQRARNNAERAGVARTLRLVRGAGEQLPLQTGRFDLVLVLGLIPWVPSPSGILAEVVRVLAPDGHLIVSCDNSERLTVLIDPRYTPAFAGIRAAARRLRGSRDAPAMAGPSAERHSPVELDGLLHDAGARVVRGRTLGFGPFSFLGREVLPRGAAVHLHNSLQRLADNGLPGVRSTGTQCLALAARR